jgi:serine/threonine protein kinase
MVGKTIGKYRFIAKLGRGAMGTVYKAVDETLDREVAIKILNPELADSAVMKRFRAEASMLAKLNHPAIATIFELHRSDDDLLMVMEFVRGESLDQFVQRCGPVEPERAAYLLGQVLDAIGHAHAAGIIHRDLKPSNVMVTESGTAKIMDFGIARVRGAEHMTTDGYMMGTPAYMSPEQVLCQEVDGRSDLYSVGVMFYRLLTGRLPFESDTAIGMVQKQISDTPTPARRHRAELPEWTLAIIDRALAKSPADRYQTAEDLRMALLDPTHSGAAEATRLLSSSGLMRPAKAPAPTADPNAETSMSAVPPRAAPAPGVQQPIEPRPTTPVAQVSGPIKPAGTTGTATRKKPKAAALVAIVTIGALAIGITAWRRSRASSQTTAVSADATASAPSTAPSTAPPPADVPPASPVQEAAAPPAPAPAPVPPPPAATPVDTAATAITATPPATPTGTPVTAAPTRPARAARSTPPPPLEPAPEPAAPPVVAAPAPKEVAAPIQFLAKILVKDNDKPRERDATVRLAEGQVTVTAQDRTILSALPYDAVLSVIYSKSRQPLWDAPGGAVPIQRLEGGAFGFLKGGRHWISLRTKERFIVLRVEENQVPSVLSAIEERTGKTTVRVAEPKGSP